MKILLIEDDREAATYLMQALDEAGHVTHHASDGETGQAMASSMDYDVLIVDRMLPRRDGLSSSRCAPRATRPRCSSFRRSAKSTIASRA